ncbi:MAG: hypothetical protein IKU86_13650 [Thermoguttaceae bacterium]|nr:hypothetical protein [Thermoguttaceae bacterium]
MFFLPITIYDTIKGGWEGVLCTKNDCEISDDDVWRLKTETVALPLCTVYPNDKVRVMSGNKRWYFCRKLEPVANKRVFVKSEIEIAKDILVKRLCTKDALRQSALNRVETTKFKEFVNTRRPDQVMSEIQETLSCSHEEAEKYAVHALQLITEALDKEAGKMSLNLEKLRMEEKALQERVV